MARSIESFLGLTPEEIEKRKKSLRESIPTIPGTEYLKAIAKKFEVQPWPFLIYLAHYAPDKLSESLSCYVDYDGDENYHTILEQLKEHYIIWKVISDLRPEQKQRGCS